MVAESNLKTDTADKISDFSEIRLASVVIAIILFLSYWLGSVGVSDIPSIFPLLLSISILQLPGIFNKFSRAPESFLQVLVLLFFMVLGWLSILLRVDLSIILYVTFFISLFSFFKMRGFHLKGNKWLKLSLFILLGFSLVNLVWHLDYMNPISPVGFAAGIRFVHVDTLFLSSITSNIKNYQVATTGLFGLHPITYHAGSNYLFASYAQLCKMSVLQFYNLGYPVIFVPLFIQSLMYASYSNLKSSSSTFRLVISFVILFFVLTGFGPTKFGERYLLPYSLNSHFVSQSYCVSLILAFLAINIYSPLIKEKFVHKNKKINLFLVLCIPLWFFIIGYVKISTAIIIFPVFTYLLLRRYQLIHKWILFSVPISFLVLYYVMQLTVERNTSSFVIELGSYYKLYLKGNIIIYLLLYYQFFFILAFCILLLLNRGKEIFLRKLLDGKFLILELILVAAIIGILPGLLIHIEGGSAGYFSDIQYWLTIIALLHFFPYIIYKYFKKRKVILVPLRILTVVLAILIIRESIFRDFYSYLKKNLDIRAMLIHDKDTSFKSLLNSTDFVPLVKSLTTEIRQSQRFNENIRMLNLPLFDSLRTLSQEVRSTAIVYCEDPDYLKSFLTCAEATFYIPAMSELPMINGLFWADECYAIAAYGMREYQNSPSRILKEQAFLLAREKGFKNLIILNLRIGTYHIEKL